MALSPTFPNYWFYPFIVSWLPIKKWWSSSSLCQLLLVYQRVFSFIPTRQVTNKASSLEIAAMSRPRQYWSEPPATGSLFFRCRRENPWRNGRKCGDITNLICGFVRKLQEDLNFSAVWKSFSPCCDGYLMLFGGIQHFQTCPRTIVKTMGFWCTRSWAFDYVLLEIDARHDSCSLFQVHKNFSR